MLEYLAVATLQVIIEKIQGITKLRMSETKIFHKKTKLTAGEDCYIQLP